MSKQYTWVIFLVTKASLSRITFKLLESGYGVSSGFTTHKLSENSEGSVPVCLFINDEQNKFEGDYKLASRILCAILVALKAPYHGSILFADNVHACIGHGYMPTYDPQTIKSTKPVPKSPTKNENNVVPFVPKDDGIIDG